MLWRVYNKSGTSDTVRADMIRTQIHTGDLWFCDKCDYSTDGNFQPKFIVAQSEYLKVKRIESPLNQPETEINNDESNKFPRNKRKNEYDNIIDC